MRLLKDGAQYPLLLHEIAACARSVIDRISHSGTHSVRLPVAHAGAGYVGADVERIILTLVQ